MKTFLLYSLLFLSSPTGNSLIEKHNSLAGKVIKIVDGDTFDLLTDSRLTMRIRINGIDCPERRQDHYQVCKDALSDLIFGKTVQLITHGTDRYKRTIADVFWNGKNISLFMIEKGFAWQYKKYSTDTILANAERNARTAKTGLWQNKNPVAPWDFRKYHRKQLNKILN